MSDSFKGQMAAYKQAIDADIAQYASHIRAITHEQYGKHGAAVTEALLDLLERGGKRIRGTLAMVAYEMCGGRDHRMILRAATALEMIHVYLLIIDDIQDRSLLRRGQPTVHDVLSSYHLTQGFKGDSAHTGMSLALNAALTANHAAQMLLAGLQVDDELRVKVLGIVNQAVLVTGYGQTSDIVNELTGEATVDDIERTMEWKTAYYTVLNPLCVGMVLAGMGCEDTDAIRKFAIPAGKAFQITDDIIGIFGDSAATGKTAMDDIREGKQTLLTAYALTHASAEDRAFLQDCLGDRDLTAEGFARCVAVIERCGAKAYAASVATHHATDAINALNAAAAERQWNPEQVEFLRTLANHLTARQE